MKKLFVISLSLLGLTCLEGTEAEARQGHGSHSVRSHVRRNGQVVQPHMRTNPSSGMTRDNWSTSGNYNPHTGKPGRTSPYR